MAQGSEAAAHAAIAALFVAFRLDLQPEEAPTNVETRRAEPLPQATTGLDLDHLDSKQRCHLKATFA